MSAHAHVAKQPWAERSGVQRRVFLLAIFSLFMLTQLFTVIVIVRMFRPDFAVVDANTVLGFLVAICGLCAPSMFLLHIRILKLEKRIDELQPNAQPKGR
jgi:hypothetical protein